MVKDSSFSPDAKALLKEVASKVANGKPMRVAQQRLTTTVRDERIKAALLMPGSNLMTRAELAKTIPCSVRDLRRVERQLAITCGEFTGRLLHSEVAQARLADYQTEIMERFPLDDRVDCLIDIAKNVKAPTAALAAIRYLDRLSGIILPAEQARLALQEDRMQPPEQEEGRMFVLPEDSIPIINVEVEGMPEEPPLPDD